MFFILQADCREEQEHRDDADGDVAGACQLGQRRAAGVPGRYQSSQQNVDHDQVNAQRPYQTVLKSLDGEADAEDQTGSEEMRHDFLVAAFEEEQTDQHPEQAKEAEYSAEVDAVISANREEVHTEAGEELCEAAKQNGDPAQGSLQLVMVGAFDAYAYLLQTETEHGSDKTEQTDRFRVYGVHIITP